MWQSPVSSGISSLTPDLNSQTVNLDRWRFGMIVRRSPGLNRLLSGPGGGAHRCTEALPARHCGQLSRLRFHIWVIYPGFGLAPACIVTALEWVGKPVVVLSIRMGMPFWRSEVPDVISGCRLTVQRLAALWRWRRDGRIFILSGRGPV